MEQASPGTKHNFLFGYLDRARTAFQSLDQPILTECLSCGQITTGDICAFCKLSDQVRSRLSDHSGPRTSAASAEPSPKSAAPPAELE
jgi:hypothetical protein